MIGPQTNEVMNAAGAPPGGYGPPPGGYGPPPGGGSGGYGPPPGGGGYGPPPGGGSGGFAPPPGGGAPGGPAQAQPPGMPPATGAVAAKKGKGGLIAGIVIAVVALGGIAAGAWYWLNATGPNLAKFAPKDTQLYVEFPSTTKAVVSMLKMDVVDTAELDTDKQKDDMVEGFANSFDVSKDDAESFLKSLDGVAYAAIDVGKRDKETYEDKSQKAILIKVGSAGPAETLLGSKRFEKDGDLAGGTKYVITRREIEDADKLEKMSFWEKAFNDLGERKKKKGEDEGDDGDKKKKKSGKVFVWFESEKLFVTGDEDMVEEIGKVIKGDKESLAKANDTFKKASWPGGSSLLVYFDPAAIDDKDDVKKDYFDGAGPITANMKFDSAGVVMNGHVELKGKKVSKMDENLLPKEVSFSLYEKVPSDTVVYFAFSGKFPGSGKDTQKAILKALEDTGDKGAENLDKSLDEMEKQVGFNLDTIFDAMGDEGIIAITADDKIDADVLKGSKKEMGEAALDHLGMVVIFQVKDKDKAEKIVKGVKDAVEDKGKDAFDVAKKDGGFLAEPKEEITKLMPLPSFGLTIEKDKFLLFTVGSKKKIDRMKSAFDGEETLKDDKAHAKAWKAISNKAQAAMWMDVGRIGKIAKKAIDDDTKKEMKKKGMSIDAIKVEGDDRLTAAMSVRATRKDDVMSYDMETLNAPILGAASSGLFLMRALSGLDTPKKHSRDDDDSPTPTPTEAPTPTPSLGGDLPVTGIKACDDYLAYAKKCADKMPGDGKKSMMDSLKKTADTYKQLGANANTRSSIEDSCKKVMEAMKGTCD